MHDVMSPCQPDPVRFTPVQARRPSRVTGSTYGSCPLFRFVPEVVPARSCKSAGASGVVAASAASLMHPVSEVGDDSFDGGVVPRGGMNSKIVARRAGAPGVIGARRALSTGCLRKAAEMISICSIRAGR
ncbi:hypothetical protein GCM10010336_69150 [Streptomyces goshikiensis]|nr:hypothetical protein GCM10010336_69150 [Streptomyces goshikiensis]